MRVTCPSFWEADKALKFILEILKKFDILEANFQKKIKVNGTMFQVAIQNTDQRFTDVRAPASQITYRVVATNCEIGKKYTFNFFTKYGRATQIQVKDLKTGFIQTFGTISGAFGFTASNQTMSFDVTVKGAR